MKLETGNLKLDRHATIDSLSYESRVIIETWEYEIEIALYVGQTDGLAGRLIIQFLNRYHGLKFDCAALEWITKLVMKWRSKTPDRNQQAASIGLAIFRQRMVK